MCQKTNRISVLSNDRKALMERNSFTHPLLNQGGALGHLEYYYYHYVYFITVIIINQCTNKLLTRRVIFHHYGTGPVNSGSASNSNIIQHSWLHKLVCQ